MLVQARAIALLSEAARYCDDDTRLQRIVPYLVVRCKPYSTLSRMGAPIQTLTLVLVQGGTVHTFAPKPFLRDGRSHISALL